MSVSDINLTLTLDVGFTLDFGHPTSQPKFNQISTSYDVVCLFCACWDSVIIAGHIVTQCYNFPHLLVIEALKKLSKLLNNSLEIKIIADLSHFK